MLSLCEEPKTVDAGTPVTVTSEEGSADVLNIRHGDGLDDQTEKRRQAGLAAHASQHAE